MRVIPSRADGEGPHTNSSASRRGKARVAVAGSLSVCALRDDSGRKRLQISAPHLRLQHSFLEEMLPSQHEALTLHEPCGIDQLGRLDARHKAKKQIHGSQPAAGAESRHSIARNAEIRKQPVRIVRHCAGQLLYDPGQRRFTEAIEKEVRHDEIIVMLGWTPRRYVVMQKTDASSTITQFIFDAFARQLQHSLARVDAIDLDSRMEPQQFTKKSSIPLAYDKRTSRGGDLSETRDATTLEVITEGDPLQRPIPRRERVEAHAFMKNSASSGVSKTISASAVR